MLTVDMILAMSEDELRANYAKADLVACIDQATVRLLIACDDLEAAALNLDPLESTGTAVDEIYDHENCDPSLEHYLDKDGNHRVR